MIAEEFARYRREVIPANASQLQITECERAFFGGAMVMLSRLHETPENEREAEKYIADLHVELDEYGKAAYALAYPCPKSPAS